MWLILLFVWLVVLVFLRPRSLKEQVVAAQENARVAAEHARELYALAYPNKD